MNFVFPVRRIIEYLKTIIFYYLIFHQDQVKKRYLEKVTFLKNSKTKHNKSLAPELSVPRNLKQVAAVVVVVAVA